MFHLAPFAATQLLVVAVTGGANGRGWIDLFARSDITIIGDTSKKIAPVSKAK